MLKTLRALLEGLKTNRGSTFKSVPYSPNVVDKHVKNYLNQIDILEKRPRNEIKRQTDKKAVCGSLNGMFFVFLVRTFFLIFIFFSGNPSYKWICW
jgi:hypothetical protein